MIEFIAILAGLGISLIAWALLRNPPPKYPYLTPKAPELDPDKDRWN